MNAIKRILMIMVITLLAGGLTYADHPVIKKNRPLTKVYNLTFEQATNTPELVKAIHIQLDDDFLWTNQSYYTVLVRYKEQYVQITGSYLQWLSFFQLRYTDTNPKYLPKGIE